MHRGVERGRGAVPTPLLDAGDGDRHFRAGTDEDGDVEDPVLLGADELLAVVEQHGFVERVDDRELGHRTGIRGLADREATRQCLVERDVAGDRITGREERRDHDAAVLDRVAELESESGRECHAVLLFGVHQGVRIGGRRSYDGIEALLARGRSGSYLTRCCA